MKLLQALLFAALAASVGIVGCTDDSGGGGTAGSGGTAGTGGTAGSGGMGGEVFCDVGACLVDDGRRESCENQVSVCIAGEVANEERCIAAGELLFCTEDGAGGTGGSGGAAGSGGTGGAAGSGGTGGTEPEVFCDEGLCLEDQDLQDSCDAAVAGCIAEGINEEECVAAGLLLFCTEPDPNVICDTGLCMTDPERDDTCQGLVGYCIAEEPQGNWEECFVFARTFICGEDGGGGTGGTGGAAGGGGQGGAGGAPDPDVLCSEGDCAVEGPQKDACTLVVAYCIAEEPEGTWDECFAFAGTIICGAPQ